VDKKALESRRLRKRIGLGDEKERDSHLIG